MSKNVTLNHVDFEKLKKQAEAARAEYLRRHGSATAVWVSSTLRAHRVAAVVAILFISFGVKMFFLSAPTAEANIHAKASAGMNVHQMQIDHPNKSNLPVQKVDDMSLVFPGP